MSEEIQNLKQQLKSLKAEKEDAFLQLQDKSEIIEELELEIEDFTLNVEQNMIKICDHEEIMNQEIINIESNLQLKYKMLKNGSQQEIDSLFDQMKTQYEAQYDLKE